jgi:hypothetical protein
VVIIGSHAQHQTVLPVERDLAALTVLAAAIITACTCDGLRHVQRKAWHFMLPVERDLAALTVLAAAQHQSFMTP